MLYEYKQQLLMKCERQEEGRVERRGEIVKKGGDEEVMRRRERGERQVNEKKGSMIRPTGGVREGRTMGEMEGGRDGLRGLEEVSRGERRTDEEQTATGTLLERRVPPEVLHRTVCI